MLDIDGPQYSTLTPFSSPGLHFDTGGQTNMGRAFGQAVLRTQPATLLVASIQPSGELVVRLSGVSGTSNSVDRSTSPVGPWSNFTNLVLDTNGTGEIQDLNTNAAGMFYRSHRP